MKNRVFNCDCMDIMKNYKDNQFDLCIVDPPYGIGEAAGKNKSRSNLAMAKNYKSKEWDNKIPEKKYFDELRRICKNQIIWGGNYFIDFLNNTSCFIVWDKENGLTDFADCELAYTSFKSAVRLFKYRWSGMLQKNMKNKEKRIHPTQKPVDLYKWFLTNYAKPGQTIFDSHVGSGSIRIACHDLGFDFEGCELDQDYWKVQEDRFKTHIAQGELFGSEELQELIYD